MPAVNHNNYRAVTDVLCPACNANYAIVGFYDTWHAPSDDIGDAFFNVGIVPNKEYDDEERPFRIQCTTRILHAGESVDREQQWDPYGESVCEYIICPTCGHHHEAALLGTFTLGGY